MKLLQTVVWFIITTSTCLAQANQDSLLMRIKNESSENFSSSLVILKNGKLILEEYDGGRDSLVNIQSITKAIVNLAIGILIDEKKIDSLDIPIFNYYPELNQGKKRNITIRHLLNHTSGLDNNYDPDLERLSMIQVAIASDLINDPGSRVAYNNVAFNLLSGIIEKISGLPLDKFVSKKIFKPIGVNRYRWFKDGSGKPIAYGGCYLSSSDLLKVGQLILNKGKWNSTVIVSEYWLLQCIPEYVEGYIFGQKGSNYLMPLTWQLRSSKETYFISSQLYDQLINCSAMEKRFIDPFSNLVNKEIADEFWDTWEIIMKEPMDNRLFVSQLRECGLAFPLVKSNIVGYGHSGGGGQYLLIYPKQNIVIVRTVSENKVAANPSLTDWDSFYRTMQLLINE